MLLSVLMIVTCINPYSLAPIAATEQPEVSVETTKNQQAEKDSEKVSEALEIRADEAGLEKQSLEETATEELQNEKELAVEESEDIKLEKQQQGREDLKNAPYTEEDFFISGISFTALTLKGKAKLAAKDGVLEFPDLVTDKGNLVSRIGPGGAGFKNLGIKSVIFSQNIKEINSQAFYDNEIEELILPNTIVNIGYGAFNKNKISKLKLSENCPILQPSVFANNQISEVDIPEGVTEIRVNAFENNPGSSVHENKVVLHVVDVSKINFYNDKPETYHIIEKASNNDYSASDFTFKDVNSGIEITGLTASGKEKQKTNHNLNIPGVINGKTVTVIGVKAFDNSKSEDKFISVEFPATLTVIGSFSFQGNDIKELSIPESVKKIDLGAFKSNSLVQGKVIVDNTEENVSIGHWAFAAQKPNDVKVTPIFRDTKAYNILVEAADCVKIEEIDPGFLVKDGEKVTVKFEITDETKELSEVTVKTTVDNQTVEFNGDSFVMPKSDVKIIVSVKDKLSNDKWLAEDFTYGYLDIQKVDNQGNAAIVRLRAVTGFSDKGKEKLKTDKNLILPKKDTDGKDVQAVAARAFAGVFGKKSLNTLSIPEGYVAIGNMAFAFTRCGGDLVLPSTMELVDFAAFFRNEFISLTIPEKMTELPMSMMRGNRLTKVIIKGNLETIGRLAFSENRLEEIEIPDSLKEIGEQAFLVNYGHLGFDEKVVLRTRSGNNPNELKDKENYIINPKGSPVYPSINFDKWDTDDFEYAGQTVTGFSKTGLKKITRNKDLVIPDNTKDGKAVLKIGIDAFRNLQKNYDIESVKIPDTVQEIEDYALQFNFIKEVRLPRDLKTLGMGVFMMSNVEKLTFNYKLEYIDQICFNGNDLKEVVLPASVHTVMNAAFREAGLTSLSFADGSKLKTIERLAFADNELTDVKLPDGLEKIGVQAFINGKAGGNNQFTELNVPASLKEIGYQAFSGNKGVEKYGNAVVIHTPGGKNPARLKDDMGKTFVIDPEVKATQADKDALKAVIAESKKIDVNKLTNDYKEFFTELLEDAEKAVKNPDASAGSVNGLAESLKWANGRAVLNLLMFEKEALDPKAASFDKTKWASVVKAYNAAKKNLMTINIDDLKLQKLITDLDTALKSLNNTGILEGAVAYTGEADVPASHYIKPYVIKVKVWVKDGKIVFVEDNGTVCDSSGGHHQPNKGYFDRAIAILNKYIGKSVEDVKKANGLGGSLGIDAISGATVSCDVLHNAIRNALSKIQPPQPQPQPDPQPQSQPSEPNNNYTPSITPIEIGGSGSGASSSSGSALGSTSVISDDETPLAPATNPIAVFKSGTGVLKVADKKLADLIGTKFEQIKFIAKNVGLTMSSDGFRALYNEGKGVTKVKISVKSLKKNSNIDINKLAVKNMYGIELMISGKAVAGFKEKVLLEIPYKAKSKSIVFYVMDIETGKKIKARLNKKTQMIEIKTNKLGKYVILKEK